MKISAIICEYNPFHNGHRYQIKHTHATHTVAIMSGNFTQRGIPSVISKTAKAEIALKNGCDLVIELPTPYAVASAERFAFGATFLADALNCVDILSFGCENDNLAKLQKAAHVSSFAEVLALTKENLKSGISFVKARHNAIEALFSTALATLLASPNNILAVEYIKSLNALGSSISPMPILRKECGCSSSVTVKSFANSTVLRKMLFKSDKNIKNFMPQSAYKILKREIGCGRAPASLLNCERAILAKLRCMQPDDFLQVPDVCEGLENKIHKAVRKATSLAELYSGVKSKRYTQLRVQRIILAAFLGLDKEILNINPPYIKVLGFNERGKEILKIAKKSAKLPIVTKVSDIKKLCENPVAARFFKIESQAFDLYNLMLPRAAACGFEGKNQIIKI